MFSLFADISIYLVIHYLELFPPTLGVSYGAQGLMNLTIFYDH